ncbi:Phosphatidylinositol-binding clathrin assembly protein [Labeo rohita]|uniref:Phosphatidylinositol-binding clathrin assembly protein n=1 Tax=Labeo rohita TaxID=84645 RepID=A0ABQ8MJQ4_LABRO|nr:Phosphatidylinositol-binding clathrin assembly protein [Labeo rohita]
MASARTILFLCAKQILPDRRACHQVHMLVLPWGETSLRLHPTPRMLCAAFCFFFFNPHLCEPGGTGLDGGGELQQTYLAAQRELRGVCILIISSLYPQRFIQYLASRNTLFNLNNFLDKGALQGYDMSTFIRRYSRYLNEKALSYRLVAVDFTKMKRGIDGVMRTMNTEKLIKTLPIIQNQLDALLDFQANPNELTNGVINTAFMLLFKDSIRLFAAYNEGVINLLDSPECFDSPLMEKYFDMKKNQCKDALDIYKKFLYRMTKLSEFLKVAEQVGIDQGDIPDLTQTTRGSYLAPSSLLEALEQHLASLEGKKTKELSADNRANTLSNAVSSLSNTGMSFSFSSSRMDEKEKQQALEEEQARLQALKNQRLKEIGMQTPSASPSTQSMGSANNHTAGMDLFTNTTSPPSTNSMPNLNSDLFDLQPAFVPAVQSTPISTASSAWGGLESSTLHPMASMPTMNVDFDAVFGTKASNSDVKPSAGYDALGDLLKPTVTVHSQVPVMPPHTGSKLLANDLDSSLANLVGSESLSLAALLTCSLGEHQAKSLICSGLSLGRRS